MADDWPGHHEELGRKTMEQVEKYTRAYGAETITKREFYLIVTSIYHATSGLMSRDLSDIISNIQAELRGEVPAQRRK